MLSSRFFQSSHLQTIIPIEFSSAVKTKPATSENEMTREAVEIVWLKSILNLEYDQLGLTSSEDGNRFKAIMVLLFHEQFKSSHEWEKAQSDLAAKVIGKFMTNTLWYCTKLYLFDNPLKKLLKNTELNDQERFEQFELIFDKIYQDIFGSVIAFSDLQNQLFMESDRVEFNEFFSPIVRCVRKLAMIICNARPPAPQQIVAMDDMKIETSENSLTVIDSPALKITSSTDNEFNQILKEIEKIGPELILLLSSKLINSQVAKFDFESMRQSNNLQSPENIEKVKKLAKEMKFEYVNDLIYVGKKYTNSHVKFLKMYENTCKMIQEQIPVFNEKVFEFSYKNAFSIFTSKNKELNYLMSYSCELYLMQATYPQFQFEILSTINALAPVIHISIDDFAELVKNGNNAIFTLRDILQWASSAWKTGESFYHEKKASMENAQLLDAKSEDNSLIASSQVGALTLFSGGQASAFLTNARAEILISCPKALAQYKAELKELKEDSVYDKKLIAKFFEDKIGHVYTLPDLSALSFIYRNESVSKWTSSKDLFAKRAHFIMTASLQSDKLTPNEKIELIETWKAHAFFNGFFAQRSLARAKEELLHVKLAPVVN